MTSWNPQKLKELSERNNRDPHGKSTLASDGSTIFKVADAIRKSGVQEEQTQNIINAVLSQGIVFREIVK